MKSCLEIVELVNQMVRNEILWSDGTHRRTEGSNPDPEPFGPQTGLKVT